MVRSKRTGSAVSVSVVTPVVVVTEIWYIGSRTLASIFDGKRESNMTRFKQPRSGLTRVREAVRALQRLVDRRLMTNSQAEKILEQAMVKALRIGAGQKQP